MSSSFLDKIIYKQERLGVVQKDGKTYVKYKKARRFRLSGGFKYAVLWFFVLVALGLGVRFLMSYLAAREPAPETAAEGI